jgi:hypothetical protein
MALPREHGTRIQRRLYSNQLPFDAQIITWQAGSFDGALLSVPVIPVRARVRQSQGIGVMHQVRSDPTDVDGRTRQE